MVFPFSAPKNTVKLNLLMLFSGANIRCLFYSHKRFRLNAQYTR